MQFILFLKYHLNYGGQYIAAESTKTSNDSIQLPIVLLTKKKLPIVHSKCIYPSDKSYASEVHFTGVHYAQKQEHIIHLKHVKKSHFFRRCTGARSQNHYRQ
jgi:hypothetical protein